MARRRRAVIRDAFVALVAAIIVVEGLKLLALVFAVP